MNGTFRDPGIDDGEKSVYRIGIADRSQRFLVGHTVGHDGDRYVSVLTAGVGESFEITVEQRFLRAGGHLRAESYRARTRSGDVVVSREEAYFLGTRHLQFGGAIEPFPANVMPLIGGLTLLRGLEFRKGAKAEFDVWLAFSVHWPLRTRVEKLTAVAVPPGRIDCWQVRVRPSFAHVNTVLDTVIAGFLPPFVAHFAAQAPHRLVRFGFPTGPMPWNPRGVLELVS
ncbi:hypothetical protein [Nocardia sp. IFM 10818]